MEDLHAVGLNTATLVGSRSKDVKGKGGFKSTVDDL